MSNLPNKDQKYISKNHHISFDPYDKEKELKQYLLDQYDNLQLAESMGEDNNCYILDIRERFFTLLKNIEIKEVIRYFPDICMVDMYDSDINPSIDDRTPFFWINFNKQFGNTLDLNVYNIHYDPDIAIFIISLWDVNIISFDIKNPVGYLLTWIKLISKKYRCFYMRHPKGCPWRQLC